MIAWQFEKSGIFSVKSAYRLALSNDDNLGTTGSSSSPMGERIVWKQVWKLPVRPKVWTFIWKFIHNALPTNENRHYRHISTDALCEMCNCDSEDSYHATIMCPHAKALRKAMRRWWKFPKDDELLNTGPEWFLVLLSNKDEKEMANLAMIMWRAWTVRNKVTRAGESLSINDSVEYLKRLNDDLQQGEVSQGARSSVPAVSAKIWKPQIQGGIKMNVDGAYNPRTGSATIGVTARDHDCNPHIMAWRVLFRCRDAEEAEALACLEGIRLAERWPADVQVLIETDCATVVEKVNNPATDRSIIAPIISDIKIEASRRQVCRVIKTGRDQNRIAHNLAQFAMRTQSSKVSFSFVPNCIHDLVCNDRFANRNYVDRT
jgi:ribonuclease HI